MLLSHPHHFPRVPLLVEKLHEKEKVLPYIQLDEHGNEFPWKKVEVLNIPNPGWKPGSEKSKTHCVIVAIKPAAKELLSMSKKE